MNEGVVGADFRVFVVEFYGESGRLVEGKWDGVGKLLTEDL